MKKILTMNLQKYLVYKINDQLKSANVLNRSEYIRKAIVWFLDEFGPDLEQLSGAAEDLICTANIEREIADKLDQLVKTNAVVSRSEIFRTALLLYTHKIDKEIEEEKAREAEKVKTVIAVDDLVKIQTPEGYKSYKIMKI